jgi:hypothetical protein
LASLRFVSSFNGAERDPNFIALGALDPRFYNHTHDHPTIRFKTNIMAPELG